MLLFVILKSSNVLLGRDFEACLTDYCLAVLASPVVDEDPDSASYKSPETRNPSREATSKSDVYAFGILLLELLTGKPPAQHPVLMPNDMMNWVRSTRDDDGDDGEDNRMGMIQDIKESINGGPTRWVILGFVENLFQ